MGLRYANARRVADVEFGPDPNRRHVLGLVRDTVNRVQGRLVRAYVGMDGAPETSYGGTGAFNLQSFVGGGSRGTTNVVADPFGQDISNVLTGDDSARRMFAQRLARGQAVL